jgi:hypothetical protein
MVIYRDPKWLYDEENMPNAIIVNSVLLLLVAHHYNRSEYEIAIPFMLIFTFSVLGEFYKDHKANPMEEKKKEVLLDRIVMVIIFSHLFHTFYPKISFPIFVALGLASLFVWYKTDDRIVYLLYQLMGILLFVGFYDISYTYKVPITISMVLLLFSEIMEKGWFHVPKHVGFAGLSILL